MRYKKKILSALLLSSSLVLLQSPVVAQNLPGNAIDEATVTADIQNIFALAQQAYPATLPSAGASGWRIFQGFTFKYFAATGIYVGIKDGQVHLLGGPYATVTPYGSVAAVTSALQARINNINNPNPGTPVADFGGFVVARTLKDLLARFSSITMEYYSGFGTLLTTAQIKIDVVGQEAVGGVNTDHLKYSISSAGGNPLVYDFWVDANGNFQQIALGSFIYSAAQAQSLGPSFVSGFLIALAAADTPQLAAALNNELQSPALSTKVTKRIVGDMEADTIQVTVAANGANVTAYISDFGSFTMMTEYSSTLSTMRSGFEIIDMDLR